jgi:hypothetical protein
LIGERRMCFVLRLYAELVYFTMIFYGLVEKEITQVTQIKAHNRVMIHLPHFRYFLWILVCS